MAVITISRQVGSGSKEIAGRLCEQLGYTFFDKRLMAQVATDVGLTTYDIVDFSEDDYKLKGFFGRLLARGTRRAAEIEPGLAPVSERVTVEQLDERRCVEFVRSTLLAAYHRGNVVIIGRGGQAILRDLPDVLHVRLEAPEGTRIRRLMEQENCSFAQAYQLLTDRDRATAEYLTEYFGIRWEDPMLYHLVINTGRVEPPVAAQLIATALETLKAVPAEALAAAKE